MKPGDRFYLRWEDLLRLKPGQHIRTYAPIEWPYFWLGKEAESQEGIMPFDVSGFNLIEVTL